MNNKKKGSPLFSFFGSKAKDEKNGGGSAVLEGEGEEEEDLFGDEDDEIFSRISEDIILTDSILEEDPSQPSTSGFVGRPSPSTSGFVGRPSPSTHVSSFGKVTPHSRPVEKLPDFDEEAGTTWIYPVNYPLRNYQYSMVENALFKNTLISLPTGLGKTFIAAVVMYNFYRWYPTCKVVFMAPTKPLVAQQVEACFNIMGIPQEDISQMTGTLNPEKRIQQWTEKRVFFLTPQVLDNDLSRGTCPAKLIRCLVLDEAHRAQGNHSYCQVVRGLKEHGHDFRILALSATPGSDMLAVRQVLTNLFISHVELRNEDSADLQEYTFQRNIEKVVVPLGEELTNLSGKYLKILRIYVSRLIELQVLYTRDEKSLTKFQLLKSRECFRQNPPTTLPRNKFGVVEGLFALCMTLYHAYELMMQHGIRSFYRFLTETLSNEKSHFFARSELHANGPFQSLMNDISKKLDAVSGGATFYKQESAVLFSQVGSPRKPEITPKAPLFTSHPKMAKLLSIVLEHHQKFADEDKSTRIMIFSQYRDSVMEITEMLQQHHPLVKAMSFIGHNKVGQSGKGLTQKKQIQVVSKFREGGYNTLVSTCVGEEGLDIGDVDLIICYDAPKSPIRLVQRMGRTGRKREGRIVMLLTKGKEEQSYNASQYQKKAINTALGDTRKLARYLVPNSPRMVPQGLSPSCIKLHMAGDSWKTNTKVCKSKAKGKGSLLSMLSKPGSSSKKSSGGGALMSQEEWLWYKDIRVPWKEVKTLPRASLICLDASRREFDSEKHINLGSYQPWQSLPQTTHLIGHSPHSLHLVELTEFIHLNQHFGPSEDPYGLEMAAFLDMAYVEDNNGDDQLSPDFIKTPSKHPPAAYQEDGKVKKVKKKQNSDGGKRKKAKVVQSSLITDMFNRIAQSQSKAREDNHQKRDIVPGLSSFQNNAENGQMNMDNNENSLKINNNNAVEDDDVICLMDDNVNEVQSSPVIRGESQNRGNHCAGATETCEGNKLDQIPSKKSPEIRGDSHKEALFLPMPSGDSLPLDIDVPPQIIDFESGEEIEGPDSPSEVLEFCNKWLTENLKTNSNKMGRNSVAPHSRDMFEFTITEKVPGTKKVEKKSCVINNVSDFMGDNDFQQIQGNTSVFSNGEVSPVIGKSLCPKSKTTGTPGDKNNILGSPTGNKDIIGLSNVDVSPVFGRSNTLQSSTPKTVSKSLFRGITPNLSTIEEFSPISKNQYNNGASRNSFCPPTTTKKRKKENECQDNVGNLTDLHRKRFKSKLSCFARPEEPEVKFTAKISPVDTAKDVCDSPLTKGCGKGFPKKLLYEELPTKSDQCEVLTNKPCSKLNKVTGLTSSCRKTSEYKDTSVFENLCKIEALNENENLKLVTRRQEDDLNGTHSNSSNSVRDSSHPSCTPHGENTLETRKETVSVQSGRYSQQNVCKGAKVDSTKDSKVTPEPMKGFTSDTMEDYSLFACIDEHELDPCRAVATEKCEDTTSSGLTITQVLDFMKEKFTQENQNASTYTAFPKSSLNNSKDTKGNMMQTTGHPSRKLSLSLSRKNRKEPKTNKSGEFIDFDIPSTSTTTLLGGDQRNFPSKPLSLPAESNQLSPKQTMETRDANDGPKEKYVSIHNKENKEFGISESLLEDVDFELLEMPDINDVQTRNATNDKSSSSTHSSLAGICGQDNRLHERSKDHAGIKLLSRSTQDDKNDSSKLISPTQETQLLIRRKRKMYNVVGSDQEDSLVSSDTDKDASKTTATTSDNSRSSTINTCVTAPLRKAVADHLKSEFDDDDDCDFVEKLGPPHAKEEKPAKNKRKKIKKRFDYLDDEAELSKDAQFVSSDESEDEEKDYDHSFVDDGTYLSQDNEQDMKAIYLRSVVSPMKPNVNLNHRPPLKYIHDSEDSDEAVEDEELGSFVVDNSFVEYETEYVGETMLAEDPIIQQALQIQGKTKKRKDAANENKRKRIIVNESSSDEDIEVFSKMLKQTPVKNTSSKEKLHPLHQNENLYVESEIRNIGAVVNNKNNKSSCPKVYQSDSQDLEITEVKPLQPKPRDQPNKLSCGKLSLNFNRQQKFPASTVRSQTVNSQEMSKDSFVKPVTNKNITVMKEQQQSQGLGKGEGHQKMAASGGGGSGSALCTLPNPVQLQSSVLPKDDSRKGHDEGLDISFAADTLPNSTISPVRGCQSTSSTSPQLNTSNSFFVASVPFNKSLTSSQIAADSAPQGNIGVLVDSSEVQSGGNLLSCLRLRYGAQTAVVPLKHAHYAVSTRMAVARLSLAVFSSSQHRSRLVERVQGMLEMYERPVIIVETEAAKGNCTPQQALGRSRYLDTIVCACTQVNRLKLLYSKGQEETSQLLWQLLLQEKTKGFKISTEPPINNKRKQMVTFYLTLPSIGYPTAVAFAQNFSTIKEFLNSSPDCIMKKGSISILKATAVKQHITRQFREDLVGT